MKAARAESEIFAELETLCSASGYIHVLAYFSWRDNYLTYADVMTSEDMLKSYAPSRLIRTELSTLIGLMVKSPVDPALPEPARFQALIDQTEFLLEELHVALNGPMMASFTPERIASGINPFTRAEVLREPIFYGGESAYSFQYRDFAVDRYSRDDAWMRERKGFSIFEARTVIGAINQLQNAKMLATMQTMRKSHPSTWTWLPGLSFNRDEIGSETGLPKETVDAVLAAFSMPTAPTNVGFKALGDFNFANATPLIRVADREFVSLQAYALVESLYDSPYYWMAEDVGYRDTASTHRGQFTEEFTAQRLEVVFGPDHVHCNVTLIGAKGQRVGEIDILVTFGDRFLIIQCKSKKLTLEARKGNDLQLQSDFKAAVQDAYDQGLKCAHTIAAKAATVVAAGGAQLSLPDAREIYICSVVSDHYPALTVQGQQFLKYETTEIIQPPLVTDVFFFDVLAEMLATPLRFLSYINRRANYVERVTSINEFAILGYHLKRNLWFDEEPNFVMIADDFGIDLDVAMTVRREGIPGEPTPAGILTRLGGTTAFRLIKGIEDARDPILIDLGFLLLTLSEDTLRNLSDGIDQVTKQTRFDGRKHDISLGFHDGKTGITVHCSREPNAEAARALLGHCTLRKYAQKAESWFGLAVREEDGLPKLGVNLREPWVQEDRMDELTRDMIKDGNATFVGGRIKRKKIGRNDPCPCGSGKKYKKCCLN